MRIINVETGKILKKLGDVTYDSTARLLQQANDAHAEELQAYADKGILAEVVIIDNAGKE